MKLGKNRHLLCQTPHPPPPLNTTEPPSRSSAAPTQKLVVQIFLPTILLPKSDSSSSCVEIEIFAPKLQILIEIIQI